MAETLTNRVSRGREGWGARQQKPGRRKEEKVQAKEGRQFQG